MRVLITTCGLVAALLPWTIRNARELGSLVPVATNSGETFLLGNSENTTPDGGATVDISRYRALAEDLGEVDRDRYFRQKALDWIADNPAAALSLYGRKVINSFNYRNALVTHSETSRYRELVLLLSCRPILTLGVGRLVSAR